MSEAKHTPGPWRSDEYGFSVFAYDNQMKVCDLRGWGYLTGVGGLNLPHESAVPIQHANADLIAAAPDLLAALEALTDPEGHIWHGQSGECTGECSDVRAAIAKAKGQAT